MSQPTPCYSPSSPVASLHEAFTSRLSQIGARDNEESGDRLLASRQLVWLWWQGVYPERSTAANMLQPQTLGRPISASTIARVVQSGLDRGWMTETSGCLMPAPTPPRVSWPGQWSDVDPRALDTQHLWPPPGHPLIGVSRRVWSTAYLMMKTPSGCVDERKCPPLAPEPVKFLIASGRRGAEKVNLYMPQPPGQGGQGLAEVARLNYVLWNSEPAVASMVQGHFSRSLGLDQIEPSALHEPFSHLYLSWYASHLPWYLWVSWMIGRTEPSKKIS